MAAQDTPDWTSISAKAQTILLNSLPSDTRIPSSLLPPATQKSVVDFPVQSGFFTDAELKITSLPATTLVASLAAGELTATEVTKAFIKRASVAQQLTKCLTVTMFDAALLRAKQLDEHFMATGTTVGPLHGLPISLKDNFNVRGFPSSVGFTAWALDPWTDAESSLVTTLRELGAVLYVKTNVPTAMMIAETVNNVYGRTVNPLNRDLTSGGSSGGESALIAFGGSCLGVGTDIGGSLRIPASCTGIFTLKPSLGRFPHFDARSGLSGQEAIASVQGPMARTLPDLRLWSETIISSSPWLRDPKCLEIPWRPTVLPPKLKLAVLHSNSGANLPTPPVTRALRETAARLQSTGRYDIIPWDPATLHADAMALVGQFFVADGGKSIAALLAPTAEPLRPEMQPYAAAPELGTHALWQLQRARTALQAAYLRKWVDSGVDGVLGPVTPYAVAPRNGAFKSITYTMIWNLLDYSCVSFPCGVRVDRGVDGRMAEGELAGMSEGDQAVQRGYDPDEVHGLEVSLQLAAGRLREEKVLAMTERILEDLKTTPV